MIGNKTAWVKTGTLMWISSHHGMQGHSGFFGREGGYKYDRNKLFQDLRVSSSWSAAYETGGRLDSLVVVWAREFLVCRTQRVRVGG